MRHRKIWLTAGCIAAACTIFFVWFFRPRPLVHTFENFQIGSVTYFSDATPYSAPKETDFTQEITPYELWQVLSSYECTATLDPPGPYLLADVVLEVSCVHDHEPLHIVLGKDNFCYEHASGIKYAIPDGEELTEELLEMLNL